MATSKYCETLVYGNVSQEDKSKVVQFWRENFNIPTIEMRERLNRLIYIRTFQDKVISVSTAYRYAFLHHGTYWFLSTATDKNFRRRFIPRENIVSKSIDFLHALQIDGVRGVISVLENNKLNARIVERLTQMREYPHSQGKKIMYLNFDGSSF